MNYDFLKNEEELANFVKLVIPELEKGESFLLILAARRKYLAEEEKNSLTVKDTEVFRREIISKKNKIVTKIKEFCVSNDCYRDRKGILLPEHCFSVYMTINPRSEKKAAVESIKEITDRLYDGQAIHLDKIIKSQIHKAVSRKIFLDLDVDAGENDDTMLIVEQIREVIKTTPHHVVKTKNGAHVIVQAKKMEADVKKVFYKGITEIGDHMNGIIEMRSDTMLPLPGTFQGGFTPKWIKVNQN